jgi:PIN domain nuclease of toxin-antitoxin system
MRYTIDTNIFVFYASGNFQVLHRDVLCLLENYENRIYISSESVKEAIHLFQNGRIAFEWCKTPRDILDYIKREWGFLINYVKEEHLLTLADLEIVPGHNDPTDRLIIAQAITERMPLISSDRKFEHYRGQGLDFIFNPR